MTANRDGAKNANERLANTEVRGPMPRMRKLATKDVRFVPKRHSKSEPGEQTTHLRFPSTKGLASRKRPIRGFWSTPFDEGLMTHIFRSLRRFGPVDLRAQRGLFRRGGRCNRLLSEDNATCVSRIQFHRPIDPLPREFSRDFEVRRSVSRFLCLSSGLGDRFFLCGLRPKIDSSRSLWMPLRH